LAGLLGVDEEVDEELGLLRVLRLRGRRVEHRRLEELAAAGELRLARGPEDLHGTAGSLGDRGELVRPEPRHRALAARGERALDAGALDLGRDRGVRRALAEKVDGPLEPFGDGRLGDADLAVLREDLLALLAGGDLQRDIVEAVVLDAVVLAARLLRDLVRDRDVVVPGPLRVVGDLDADLLEDLRVDDDAVDVDARGHAVEL